MNLEELARTLLRLNSSWSVWESTPPFDTADDPGAMYHQRFSFTVGWSINNTLELPSEEELLQLLESPQSDT